MLPSQLQSCVSYSFFRKTANPDGCGRQPGSHQKSAPPFFVNDSRCTGVRMRIPEESSLDLPFFWSKRLGQPFPISAGFHAEAGAQDDCFVRLMAPYSKRIRI